MAKLGNYVNIKTGKLDANASSVDGKYPFFTCATTPLRIDSYSYDCECVLVAGNGDLNVKYYNGKFDAYQRTYIIESKDKAVLTVPYIYRFLEKYVETLRTLSIGGVIKYIKLGNLTEADIKIIDISEQRKIVYTLEKIDSLLNHLEQQLLCCDDLIKSRFVELFGDFNIESSFPMESLDCIADIVSGITKGRKTKETDLREVPYMAVSNVKDGYIDWTTIKTIMATEKEIEQYRIQPNDILMTEGGDPDKVGRGALINEAPEDCIHQNHIFRVRLNEKVNPIYFEAYLQQPFTKRYFLKSAKQTTGIASINMTQLRNTPVIVPPIELQNQFADFVALTDKSKFAVQQSIDTLQTLKAKLMQDYFE